MSYAVTQLPKPNSPLQANQLAAWLSKTKRMGGPLLPWF
jgi:hypothetical protein